MRRGHERMIGGPRVERADVARADDPSDGLRDRAATGVCDDMLEQIVHDLKNPLNTIALEVALLDHRLATGDPEIRAGLARISRNVFFLDRMVWDLLDSRSIASGHFEIQRKPTELRALIARVVDRVVSTRDSGRVWIEASSPLTLPIDELRIERVVANLLQNALNYTPRSSLIGIRVDVGDDHGRISVIDAGPGMAVGEAERVFDRYCRTLSGAAHDGSGLGLYVCKRIVEAHGGRIGVDSVEGGGSRFYFDLPTT